MSQAMESQLRFITVFIIILANLSLFVYTAPVQVDSFNNSSCIELNNNTIEELDINTTNCTDKIVRYFFNTSSNTCNPILTCSPVAANSTSMNTTELGHSSLLECNKHCGLRTNNICPTLVASNIVHTTCTGTSTQCKAYYNCQQGYYFFETSNERTCENGVWSSEPICRSIGIYHNGKLLRQKEVINLNQSSETIECRVFPSPLPSDISIQWTLSRTVISGQWNEDKTAYQLTVDSSQGSFPREYHCNATYGEASLTTSVILNAMISKQPEIRYSITKYVSSTSQVSGQCLCEGLPKPIIKWFLDNNEITNDAIVIDATSTSTEVTFSLLTINNADPTTHSGNYHCQCISGPHTVNGYPMNVQIPVQTVSRRRRDTTRVKATLDTPLCKLMLQHGSSSKGTTLIVGQIKRYLVSEKLLHVKVSTGDNLTETKNSLSTIIKVKLQNKQDAINMKRNKSHLMLITQTSNGQYKLEGKSLYSKELLNTLQTHCKLGQ